MLFIDIIDYRIWRIYSKLGLFGYNKLSYEIVEESYEVRSHDKTDITVYWIQYCMTEKTKKEVLNKLLKEVKRNVVEESLEKEKLIQEIKSDISGAENSLTIILVDGDFEEHQLELQTQQRLLFYEAFQLALSHKELGNYDAGLKLLKEYSDLTYAIYPYKTLIACLVILNGLTEEGLKIFDSLTFNSRNPVEKQISLSEIARALFDIGSYEKCREIYQRFRQLAPYSYPLFSFSYLDSL